MSGTDRRPGSGTRHVWLLAVAVFGILLAASLAVIDRAQPAGRGVLKITGVDPLAYYSVTHSLLYDFDVDLSNQYAVLDSDSPWLAEVAATGRRGSPFAIGYSLYQLPFLALARGLASLGDVSDDGYGRLSIALYYCGNIAATCLGLAFLFLFSTDVGSALGLSKERAAFVSGTVALVTWAGTTVGYYTLSPMPHVVTFFAMCLFLRLWWRTRRSASVRRWIPVGIAFGFLAICRWQAILYAVVPMGYDAWRLRTNRTSRGALSSRVAAGFAALSVFSLQMLEWKAIYGHWITIPQGADFFAMPRYALRVLWSTHHGWFVWTPLTLLGVVGLTVLAVRGPSTSIDRDSVGELRLLGRLCLLAIGLQVLLVGALPTSWYNRDSFSIRMLTSAAPLVALGLLALLARGDRVRRLSAVAMALAVAYTIVFAAQFRLDMIPRDDRLTVDELLTDKIFLRSLWRRHRAVSAARQALERGDLDTCIAVAESALDRSGSDRRLILLAELAHRRRGDVAAATRARERLDALLERRLY